MTRRKAGYGVFGYSCGRVLAHRFAYAAVSVSDDALPLVRDSIDRCVLHTCDEPLCCNPAHLRVGSHADNMRDRHARHRTACGDRSGARTRPDRRPRGEDHGASKLTAVQVLEIRERYTHGESCGAMCGQYDVSQHAIYDVVRGRHWKHVGGRVATGDLRRRTLTDAQVQQLRERVASGDLLVDAARDFGVSDGEVSRIARGIKRKHAGGPIAIGSLRRKKLTDGQVCQLRERVAAGDRLVDLARTFGVSDGEVSRIVRGLSYAHAGGPILASARKRKLSDAAIVAIRTARASGVPVKELSTRFSVSAVAIYKVTATT